MKTKAISVWLLSLSLLFSSVLLAEDVTVKEGAPTTYIVKQGDTLWGISGIYLEKPWLWPELWDVNPQIDNPHLIYPGDELYLVWEGGKPRLRMTRGKGGDVKLMMAIGVWLGPWLTFVSFCVGAVVGGVIAATMILATGRLWNAYANLVTIVQKASRRSTVFSEFGSAKSFGSTSQLLPYGVPLTIGTLIVFFGQDLLLG